MKLAFLGMGNMAMALSEGLIRAGKLKAEDITAYAPNQDKLRDNAERIGFRPATTPLEAVKSADIVLLACKPGQVADALRPVKECLAGKALISVALGLTHEKLRVLAGEAVRLQYVMPNTPVAVGEGILLFEKETSLTAEEQMTVRGLFSALGLIVTLPTDRMNIGGTISGCGPAFVDLMIEAFSDAGVFYGLPRDTAVALSAQMILGSAKLQRVTGIHPAVLKDAVCSPGGSTIRGVSALEKHGFRAACQAAVAAAAETVK